MVLSDALHTLFSTFVMTWSSTFNPFPNDKFSTLPKPKEFADDFEFDKMAESSL